MRTLRFFWTASVVLLLQPFTIAWTPPVLPRVGLQPTQSSSGCDGLQSVCRFERSWKSVETAFKALSEAVKRRGEPFVIDSEDAQFVQELGSEITSLSTSFRTEDHETFLQWAGLKFEEKLSLQPNVLWRLDLCQDDCLSARLHLILDKSQTLIHNHRQPFISHCLMGSYSHSKWELEDDGQHYVFKRNAETAALDGPELRRKRLVCKMLERHKPGHSYFLPQHALHSVSADYGRVLTLYVKGTSQTGNTRMVSVTPTIDYSVARKERPAKAAAASVFLKEVCKMLRHPPS